MSILTPTKPSANGAPLPRLLPKHLADLHGSGLTDEYIAAAGCFRSLTDPAGIARALGWTRPAKDLGPCLAIAFRDAEGKPTSYYRIKPDRPRLKDEKQVKYESPRGQSNRAFFPPHTRPALADAATSVILTEGEKKACKADQEGLPCVGLVGVWGWMRKRKSKDAPHELIPDLEAVVWEGRTAFICFDSDLAEKREVAFAEWHLAEALAAKGAEVKMVRLPGGPDGAKVGLDDYLLANGADAFRRLLAAAQPPTKPTDDRPEVLVSVLEYATVEQAVKALAKGAHDLYQRGGELVRVAHPKRPDLAGASRGGPRIEPLPSAALRTRLTDVARIVQFVQGKKDAPPEKQPCHPPAWLVPAVASAGVWSGVRPLEAIATTPVLLPDDTVLQRPGYHPGSGVLYLPNGEFSAVPDAPTRDDARAAVDVLMEAVADFPFRASTHRAAWFAALLTLLARFAFSGPAPLFLIDANIRGSGKSLLADLISVIVTGFSAARMAYTCDDDEMRKLILAIAVQGDLLILLDNLGGVIGNPALDAALTSVEWQGRILKETKAPRLPLLVTWIATGNNVAVQADTGRRTCHIRLDCLDEKPEERTGFRHPDLLGWARESRGRLLAAGLTILSAYCKAGRPKPEKSLKPWGSFEGWTDLIRGACVWAGLADPGDTREAFVERSDREADAVRDLIAGWKEIDGDGEGKTTSQALALLKDKDNQNRFGVLREVLADLFDLQVGKLPPAQRLGKAMARFAGRNVGGRCIDSRSGHGGVKKWLVRAIGCEGPASGGDGGVVSESDSHASRQGGRSGGGDDGDGGGAAVIRACVEKATSHMCNGSGNIPTIPIIPTMSPVNGDCRLANGLKIEEGYL